MAWAVGARTVALILAMTAAGLLALATHSLGGIPPVPTEDYPDFHRAYVVSESELGSPITLGRENGQDDDYLKLPFLRLYDVVTVRIDQSDEHSALVNYWASDPNRFPIFHRRLDVEGPGDAHVFEFRFVAVLQGPYYVHTDNSGFGSTWINFTFTRGAGDPTGAGLDDDNAPNRSSILTPGTPATEWAGLPWDPADFHVLDLDAPDDVMTYLNVSLATATGTVMDWELYTPDGANRSLERYIDDVLMTSASGASVTYRQMPTPARYYFRVWAREGEGDYTLAIDVRHYPCDHNDTMDSAYEVSDGTALVADANTLFDACDWCVIDLVKGDPLYVRVRPLDGPVDLFLMDDRGIVLVRRALPGLREELIDPWVAEYTGPHLLLVTAVVEGEWPDDPPTVSYELEVWVNAAPAVAQDAPARIDVVEDTVDESHSAAGWFADRDGDQLELSLVPVAGPYMTVELLADGRLHIVPAENVSGVSQEVSVVATDPRGLSCTRTVAVHVTPVNDAPYVDPGFSAYEIRIMEDASMSGVNLSRPFRDVDDPYWALTFRTSSTEHFTVARDVATDLWEIATAVQDWWGSEAIVVTCTDRGNLSVAATFTVVVLPVNDPPQIANYLAPLSVIDGYHLTIDLEDGERGASFLDPDGDPLTYHWTGNGSFAVSLEGALLTLRPLNGFVGIVTTMRLWAEDSLHARSGTMALLITVYTGESSRLTLILKVVTAQEGQTVTFEPGIHYSLYIYEDPGLIRYDWSVDVVPVHAGFGEEGANLTYLVPFTREGDRDVPVILRVDDGIAWMAVEWTLHILDVNRPPVGVAIVADPVGPFTAGGTIIFRVTGVDPDGGPLGARWYLDGKELRKWELSLECRDVDPGDHVVTAIVSDVDGANITAELPFVVTPRDEGGHEPGFSGGAPLQAGLIGALVAAVVVLVVLRRRLIARRHG